MSISTEIWDSKYRLKEIDGTPIDVTVEDTWLRIAKALSVNEVNTLDWKVRFYDALSDYGFLPAGRITAGAGTGRAVTLFNCFVMGTIPDSMKGIFQMLKEAALTMQQGGGIGYDFSTIRPRGAAVHGVAADASGPLSFMDVWDAMCRTIMSAGSRRGAMMATMRCDHPDIEAFIEAKKDPARLRMFNLSVLVTDAFMEAVANDEKWRLHFEDRDGVTTVERTIQARDLWDKIMRSTYAQAEPGVIFIDRINKTNNLHYCETIAATNPCVAGDTPILTDKGYIPIGQIVEQSVRVWNGIEFSNTIPRKTGENQPMLTVHLSDGSSLRCTTAHRFVLKNGIRVAAEDLFIGEKLMKSAWPIIQDGTDSDLDYYAQGFYSGDGTKQSQDRGGHYIYLYGDKRKILHEWNAQSQRTYAITGGYEGTDTTLDKDYLFFPAGTFRDKKYVPAEGTLSARKKWLAGLVDSDGCVTVDSCIQISAKDRGFLHAVKMMLNTMGVTGTLSPMKDCWRLSISANHAAILNLPTHRIKTHPVSFSKARFPVVVGIEESGIEAEVFCFTESIRHMGVFNGMLTGQCGEQPLPPYGACLLGSINLAKLVLNPFTAKASFDSQQLERLVATAVRMMDNVVDVSNFPLPQQQIEAKAKRRIGLGVTGLADALLMMGMQYGDDDAVFWTEHVMWQLAISSYSASVDLAREKGPFPLFVAEQYLAPGTFASTLPADLQQRIRKHGIRNSHLTSIAPTGTISLYAGNISSGIEPLFASSYTRKVLQPDGTRVESRVVDYAVALWESMGNEGLPPAYVDAQTLPPKAHLKMQAAAQKWIDSSISKTINLPEDMSFEAFSQVYLDAYKLGCKGCTTYRPNDVTGSVLSVDAPLEEAKLVKALKDAHPIMMVEPTVTVAPRPELLNGSTYKMKWPGADASTLYITINDDGDRPLELFLNTKNVDNFAWMAALSRTVSAVFRRGGDVTFIAEELKEVFDPKGGAWIGGKYVPSMVAAIGDVILRHMQGLKEETDFWQKVDDTLTSAKVEIVPQQCPQCKDFSLIQQNGCPTCTSCGHSKCG